MTEPGGFQLTAADASTRRLLTRADMSVFLPPGRGAFTFPEPYNTRGVRLTEPADGTIEPVGYSYWRRINNHVDRNHLQVIVGRTAAPALLLKVHKQTLHVEPSELVDLWGTGEQWYWSATDPDVLFILEAGRLLRYDVITRDRRVVLEVDESSYLWQPHSSDDGRCHSATFRAASDDSNRGAIVSRPGGVVVFPARDEFDECQIDRTGRYLLIKEGTSNRIEDLDAGTSATITDPDGAVGHSDNGPGFVVGEDDHHRQPGAFVRIAFENLSDRRLIYHTTDWQAMARHVSLAGDRALMSSACRVNVPRANELVLAPLDGSLNCTVVAPNLVDLDAGGDDYRNLPKANMDVAGEWACWSANCGTDRLDVFLVRLPT